MDGTGNSARRLARIAVLLATSPLFAGFLLLAVVAPLSAKFGVTDIVKPLLTLCLLAVPVTALASLSVGVQAWRKAGSERRAGLAEAPRGLPLLALLSGPIVAGLLCLFGWMLIDGMHWK